MLSQSRSGGGGIIDLPVFVPVPVDRRTTPAGTAPESPEIAQVRAVIASILGSLRGGPHLPESGLHWAAAYLTRDGGTELVVTTTDAGWLPRGTIVPAGVRVLWNVPTSLTWATVDDPVRQLTEYAAAHDYAVRAAATTHPSRASQIVGGPWRVVGEHGRGPIAPQRVPRFEVVASPTRVERIRALTPDGADRQTRALLRDLARVTVAPKALGSTETRAQALKYLAGGHRVPADVLSALQFDLEAVEDALREQRGDTRVYTPGNPAPDSAVLRGHLLERAVIEATLAAAYHDVESAVYAWTFARYLAS